MMSINLSDIAILNIKGTDHCCIITLISKDDAINLLQNAELTEKSGTLLKKLQIKKILKFFKVYIKMEKVIKFGEIKTQKQTFHQNKEPISIKKYRYW